MECRTVCYVSQGHPNMYLHVFNGSTKYLYYIPISQDNARLREQVDDQQAQLLSRHLEAGRSLLKVDNSLADELEQMPREKVLEFFSIGLLFIVHMNVHHSNFVKVASHI